MGRYILAMPLCAVLIAGCSHANSTMPHPAGKPPSIHVHAEALSNNAPTHYTVLHRFQVGADGTEPFAGLVRDPAGNLYGTTFRGGTGSCPTGCGVVFKVDPSGTETVLHSFDGLDGKRPTAGLILDEAGNIYGTTRWGGPKVFGVVFKLDPNNNESLIHAFSIDDGGPSSRLVRDSAGNLYGASETGMGYGTIFKLDPNGNETILHAFIKATGFFPIGGVVRDAAGNLYGTTDGGGTGGACGVGGCGVIFKVDTNDNYTVLHNFDGTDGANPEATLLRDSAGNLYGTTRRGGAVGCATNMGCGVVFRLDRSGNETVLFLFKGNTGAHPVAELIRDDDGNLFGTTESGGSFGYGVVFKLDPNGNEAVLHAFESSDGGPRGGLVRDGAGNLYGTAQYNSGNGVVFELTH